MVLLSNRKVEVIMWQSVKITVARNLLTVGAYVGTVWFLRMVWEIVGRPVLVIMP